MTYILRDHACGYFRGLLDDDVVFTWEQKRAIRFKTRDLAELAMVGHCPNADIVRLRPKKATLSKSEVQK